MSETKRDQLLTLQAPITTAADDIHKYFLHCFSEKMRLDVSSESSAEKSSLIDVSSESSARQRIYMKNQALFSLKDKMSSAASFVWRFNGKSLLLRELIISFKTQPLIGKKAKMKMNKICLP